jgi:hypothetical protein
VVSRPRYLAQLRQLLLDDGRRRVDVGRHAAEPARRLDLRKLLLRARADPVGLRSPVRKGRAALAALGRAASAARDRTRDREAQESSARTSSCSGNRPSRCFENRSRPSASTSN